MNKLHGLKLHTASAKSTSLVAQSISTDIHPCTSFQLKQQQPAVAPLRSINRNNGSAVRLKYISSSSDDEDEVVDVVDWLLESDDDVMNDSVDIDTTDRVATSAACIKHTNSTNSLLTTVSTADTVSSGKRFICAHLIYMLKIHNEFLR